MGGRVNWNISHTFVLAAGNHTITVLADPLALSSGDTIISGDGSSFRQAFLNVVVVKQ